MELAKEWEKVRTNMINQYRELRSKFADRKKESKEKLNKIKEMREQMERMKTELQQKDNKYRQLLEQYKKVPKDKTRAMYTERILEIVKNVKKQKLEIDKILMDTKELKKEINKITDKLNRSFSVTDELIFKVSFSSFHQFFKINKPSLKGCKKRLDCKASLQVLGGNERKIQHFDWTRLTNW